MNKSLKRKLSAGSQVRGVMLAANSPPLVELIASVGFDYILIDLQHTPASWETAQELVRAADLGGISSLIRVPQNTEAEILKALDIGAEGIVLPFIRNTAEVLSAYNASHYLPLGNRSICSQTRVARYGNFEGSYIDFLQGLNEDIFLMGVVEDIEGIENLPEILALNPGLDAIAIGRGDLAASMGFAGQQGNPQLLKIVDEAVKQIKASSQSDTHMAVFTYSDEEVLPWSDKGANVFCHMSEVSLFLNGARKYLEVMK